MIMQEWVICSKNIPTPHVNPYTGNVERRPRILFLSRTEKWFGGKFPLKSFIFVTCPDENCFYSSKRTLKHILNHLTTMLDPSRELFIMKKEDAIIYGVMNN